MKTFQTIEDDLGVVYAKPTNHRLDPDGRIVADYTIIDAPNDLKSEIGKFNTYRLADMRTIK
tara:strand:- start:254 stop:439 length:186 start_codon:yes stop_codon:yes gene_type:complete